MKNNKTFQEFMDDKGHGEYLLKTTLIEQLINCFDYELVCGDSETLNDYIYCYLISESCANSLKEYTDETVVYIPDCDVYGWLLANGNDWECWYYDFKKEYK